MKDKVCPLMSTATAIRYCTKGCELSVQNGDTNDYKCGFKVLLFELLDIRSALIDLRKTLMDGGGR